MNGTMVDAQTFYDDSITYTGVSGAATNPWCVEDLTDFLNIGNYNGASAEDLVYVKLVKNLDFNNHPVYQNGILMSSNLINGRFVVFMGDGKEIRNAYITGSTSASATYLFDFYEIHDLILTGIVSSSQYSRNYVRMLHTTNGMHHCSICIHLFGGCLGSVLATNLVLSSITISGNWMEDIQGLGLSFSQMVFDRCEIFFDNTVLSTDAGCSPNSGKFDGGTFTKSYFRGKASMKTTISGAREFNLISGATLTDTYFAVEISLPPEFNAGYAPTNFYVDGHNYGKSTWSHVNFIDESLLPSSITTFPTSIPTVQLLTTEDCFSTTKLQGIGFPVLQKVEGE